MHRRPVKLPLCFVGAEISPSLAHGLFQVAANLPTRAMGMSYFLPLNLQALLSES